MARGTVHAPKPDDQRRRRNAPTVSERLLTRDGEIRGVPLGELTGRHDWDPQTLAWYETWRTSPQAQVFEATDWRRLGMLAYLVEEFMTGGADTKTLAEIRQNEERLGATYTDRQRARMRIEDPVEADTSAGGTGLASVTSIDDIRARLASGA